MLPHCWRLILANGILLCVTRDALAGPPPPQLPPGAVARLGTWRWRHPAPVIDFCFSRDGKYLVTRGYDDAPRLWDIQTGRQVRCLQRKGTGVNDVALMPDGRTILTSEADQVLRFWDVSTGKFLRRYPDAGEGEVGSFFLAADGKYWAYSKPITRPTNEGKAGKPGHKDLLEIIILDTARCRERRRFQCDAELPTAFSPDGKLLAAGGFLWEVATGKKLRPLPAAKGHVVTSIAFSPDGKVMATVEAVTMKSYTILIRLSDPVIGKELRQLKGLPGHVTHLALSPDGKTLATESAEGTVCLWDVRTGNRDSLTDTHRAWLTSLAFSPDGRRLGSLDQLGGFILWKLDAGKTPVPLNQSNISITSLTYVADGRLIATNGDRIRLWDAATHKLLRDYPSPTREPNNLVLSLDGKLMALRSKEVIVELRDADSGKIRHRLAAEGNGRMCFSPRGDLLITSGFACIGWDVRTGKERRRYLKYPESNWVLAVSANGKVLAVSTASGISLMDLATGKELRKLPLYLPESSLLSLALSPDGKELAVAEWGGGEARLFDVTTGKERLAFSFPKSRAYSVAYSPNGKILAFGTEHGTLQLWETITRSKRCTLESQEGRIQSITFSPDSRRLATVQGNDTALFWPVLPDLAGVVPAKARPTPAALATCWTDLGNRNAAIGYRALQALARHPGQAVPFLRGRLRGLPDLGPRLIGRLIADLDSEKFPVRDKATNRLIRLGVIALPALRTSLPPRPSLELRRRVERIIEDIEARREKVLEPDYLRAWRSLELLEHLGTPAARRVIEELARKDRTSQLAQEARASLRRLAARETRRP